MFWYEGGMESWDCLFWRYSSEDWISWIILGCWKKRNETWVGCCIVVHSWAASAMRECLKVMRMLLPEVEDKVVYHQIDLIMDPVWGRNILEDGFHSGSGKIDREEEMNLSFGFWKRKRKRNKFWLWGKKPTSKENLSLPETKTSN